MASKPQGTANPDGTKRAIFAAGCFWGVEARFRKVPGVKNVTVGYTGGHTAHPTYEMVCSSTTGHAEAVEVTYDPREVTYAELLEVFWRMHDPTTPNRQGVDVGPQYRSVVFYLDEEQKRLAEETKRELDASGALRNPIVTEIAPAKEFWAAEPYHQNYYAKHHYFHT